MKALGNEVLANSNVGSASFALQVDKLVEHSTTQAIRQWRRLPPVISQQHIPLLQVSSQLWKTKLLL